MDASLIFKALSDTTRLRCLALLANGKELCVCELTAVLDLPQPKISHHLAALRKAELVSDRKAGLWIYYRINPGAPKWVGNVIKATIKGIRDVEPFASDAAVLADMSNNTGATCNA